MPRATETDIARLITEGQITAITLDTNIFVQKQLQLSSTKLQALARLSRSGFRLILAETVAREVAGKIENSVSKKFESARNGIDKALEAFGTRGHTLEQLLNQITGGRTSNQVAQDVFAEFVNYSNCEILNDAELVDVPSIFDDYFSGRPPFGSEKKKHEFPDAISLNALERTARERSIGILTVSNDGDWENYCKNSKHLYIVKEIEKALSLVTNAPPVLRNRIRSWLEREELGRLEFAAFMEDIVGDMGFEAEVYPSFGRCEVEVWSPQLKEINLPDEEEIDIIELTPRPDMNSSQIVVSIPITLTLRVPIDIGFYIWDSVDKESLSMGERTIDHEEMVNVITTINFNIRDQPLDEKKVEIDDVEVDNDWYQIYIGEVDPFESDPFDPEY